LIILIIFGEEYNLCSFLQLPVTSSLSGPNILLNTLFSNTLSLCSTLNVRDQWHSFFKASWVSVEDDKHSGRPSTSKTTENVEKIRELIHEDRRWTIYELADTAGISYGICQILTANFNMHCTAAKCVPRILTMIKSIGM
jgi:hypothetical protein